MYRLAEANHENREVRNLKAWLLQMSRHVLADYYRGKYKSVVESGKVIPSIITAVEPPEPSEHDFIGPHD